MKLTIRMAVGCLAVLLLAGGAIAQKKAETKTETKTSHAKATKASMPAFLIISPHTQEECLGVMDEVNKTKQLGEWDWGCASGNHTAYRIVHAPDEQAALALVPENVRAKAQVFKVGKMTPAQLDAAHKHM